MFTKEKILTLLKRLSKELLAQEIHGEILLAGGAVMCLVHSARDMTMDIDALYEPKAIINQLVNKIALEENLPANWLNDSVKGFVTTDVPREDFLMLPGLKVTKVSDEYLLAMKLMSARYGETDYEDIRFLLKTLNIADRESLLNLVMTYYAPDYIVPKTKYLIEQLFDEINSD